MPVGEDVSGQRFSHDFFDGYGLSIASTLPKNGEYDAVILTVPHEYVVDDGPDRPPALLEPGGVLLLHESGF